MKHKMKGSTLRYLVPLGIFIALAVLLFWGLKQDPHKVPSPLIGKPAPAFELESLTDPGKMIGSGILEGRLSLVNVWSSTCYACAQEHAMLERIAKEEQDLQIIGLDWMDPPEDATDPRPGLAYLARFGNPYRVILYDPDNKAGIDWGVYGTPETFLVDPQGIIRYKQIGPIDAQVWHNEILPIVNQYRPKG